MLEPSMEQALSVTRELRVKIVGVGGAGSNTLEHITHTELGGLPLAIVHSHARVLQQHSIPNRLLIGMDRTHGLGSGGDAELARAMAENDGAHLQDLARDTDLLFVIAGLGGGTGSGVTPVLARAARASGALVIALVTTPFDFEGARRHRQAQLALQQIRAAADAVICIPNQKCSDLLHGNTTIIDVFARTNDLLVHGVRGLWKMLTQPGLITVDFAYLQSVLRGRHTESVLAHTEASGPDRARELVPALLRNPLIQGGETLAESDQVLVNLSGPASLTIGEITTVMEQLRAYISDDKLTFGTAIDEGADQLALTLVVSKNVRGGIQTNAEAALEHSRSGTPALSDGAFIEDAATPRPAPRFIAPAPETTEAKTRQLLERQPGSRLRKGAVKWKQEMLQLEIVSRGRFEKSEPTIHRGADLDVPSYIRRGTPLN